MEVFLVCKKDGTLYFKDIHSFQTRNISTFKCIEEADKIYNWPDFNMIIHTGDNTKPHQYGYAKTTFYRLIPDFNFHAWPEVGINDYETTLQEMMMAGNEPPLCEKAGWVGNVNTNANRKKLLGYGKKYPILFDIISIKWLPMGDTIDYISMVDLVKKYGFLIDIEGNGYSGRLKFLLWSQRPVLLVERPYKEYFFKDLIAWTHYIPVKRNLSDLHFKMNWCLKNKSSAAKIAANALEFSKKHLTREACYAEWDRVIQTLPK
jgi:hypothetical protein